MPPPPPQSGAASPFPNTWQHEESTRTLNLTVLQRVDPFVEEILITAAPVTFYQFDLNLHQWSRKDVEGSLFVVKRNAQPRFQFIVMNRRSTDNLVEDLLGDFEFDIHFPYLLYRNAAQEVNAIWFYTEDDCKAVANLFSRILNAYSKVTPKPKVLSIKRRRRLLEIHQMQRLQDSHFNLLHLLPYLPTQTILSQLLCLPNNRPLRCKFRPLLRCHSLVVLNPEAVVMLLLTW